jgi:hypothetical protein
MTTAAEALNKSALIASDCGSEELATQLCWRQFAIFAAAAPFDAETAKTAVQPVVNLGRLLIRAHQPDHAHQVFHSMFTAADTGGPALIQEVTIDIAGLVRPEGRRELRRFLWLVLLAEGTRALTTAGKWSEALSYVTRYNGIGNRFLDGRQVAIIERFTASDTDGALDLIDTGTAAEPWELTVAAVLRAMCLRAGERRYDHAAGQAVQHFSTVSPIGGLGVFQTRLGLVVLEIAAMVALDTTEVATAILRASNTVADANVARDILGDPTCRQVIRPEQARDLAEIIETSGTARGSSTLNDLAAHVDAAESSLRTALTSGFPAPEKW